MAHSYHSISNHPYLKEGNFLLPEKPSAAQFILHKGITVPLVSHNVEAGQMTMINAMITAVVLRNIYLYKTTTKCNYGSAGPNYHVDGYIINCN